MIFSLRSKKRENDKVSTLKIPSTKYTRQNIPRKDPLDIIPQRKIPRNTPPPNDKSRHLQNPSLGIVMQFSVMQSFFKRNVGTLQNIINIKFNKHDELTLI